jgi:hypothetical protein
MIEIKVSQNATIIIYTYNTAISIKRNAHW